MADSSQLKAHMIELERELVRILEKRLGLSVELHALEEGRTSVIDVDELDWLRGLEELLTGDAPAEAVLSVLRRLRAEARGLEAQPRIAYLGPEGGFCHQVAREHFGSLAELIEAGTAADALTEVARGRAGFAVVPFESSVEGLVQSSITALSATELVIVNERYLPATLDLVSCTGNSDDIDKVYLTAAAHAASERFLGRELPRATILDVRSPVVALQLAAEDHGSAAIVPSRLFEREAPAGAQLRVARANVGDSPDLQFRYGVASARPAKRSGRDTTAILFSVDDSAGALFEALRHFAERGVNLEKLQSRPLQGESWDYIFYVEVSGHVTDRAVVTALESVKKTTRSVRVLGSFPSERE